MTRVIRSFCGTLSIKPLYTDGLLADLEFIDGNDRMGGIDCEIPLRDCAVFTIEQNMVVLTRLLF